MLMCRKLSLSCILQHKVNIRSGVVCFQAEAESRVVDFQNVSTCGIICDSLELFKSMNVKGRSREETVCRKQVFFLCLSDMNIHSWFLLALHKTHRSLIKYS